MSRTTMPTAGDLQTFLAASNIIEEPPTGDHSSLLFGAAVAAGLRWWEDATGFDPFEAAAADVTRYLSPDGTALLEPGFGITAALTSLTVGYSTTSSGTALTANQDYWLEPLNAIADGKPATLIRFSCRQTGLPRSIVVVGKLGYCPNATIPEDAWYGVLLASAAVLGPQLDALQSQGGLKRMTEGDVTYEYGALAGTWRDQATALARQFRRAVVI